MPDCGCMHPPFHYTNFVSMEIGIDATNGYETEVQIDTCRVCGSRWLKYLVQEAAVTRSGRWYRGLISAETARAITPGTAAAVLESLEWCFVGGSALNSTGLKREGPVVVDKC